MCLQTDRQDTAGRPRVKGMIFQENELIIRTLSTQVGKYR